MLAHGLGRLMSMLNRGKRSKAYPIGKQREMVSNSISQL